VIAVANGSEMKLIKEHDDNGIIFEGSLNDYNGSQINGLLIKQIDGHFFVFVSRNASYINIFEIVPKEEGDAFELKHVSDIDTGFNVNFIAFGNGPIWSDCLITCLDNFEKPLCYKYVGDNKFEECNFNLNIPWLKKDIPNENTKTDEENQREEAFVRNSMKADWSPNSSIVALGLEEGQCIVWDVASGRMIGEFQNHSKALSSSYGDSGVQIRTITFSPSVDVPILVFGESNAYLHFIDTISWNEKMIKAPSKQEINGIKFTNDGRTLIVAFTNRIAEYRVTVGIPPLSELIINYISKNMEKFDMSLLPPEVVSRIKNFNLTTSY